MLLVKNSIMMREQDSKGRAEEVLLDLEESVMVIA